MIILKDYNPKYPKEFHLERTLYNRVLSTVRDYPRMIESINDILYGGSAINDGMPKSSGIGKPTEKKAILIEQIEFTVDAINKALKLIPIEYRQYIFDNVVHKIKYPDFADRMTWSRWRMRFLYFVAVNLNWV